MTLFEMISAYINECVEENSGGFSTDFGVGKYTTVNFRNFGDFPEMSVMIRNGNSKHFNLDVVDPINVVEWIHDEISKTN